MRCCIRIAVFLHSLLKVSGISLLLQNDTSSGLIHVSNSSSPSLTLPTPPPNFNLDFQPNESIELNPVQMYLNAIAAMYELANDFQWNGVWRRPGHFSVVDSGIWIRVQREGRNLRTFHVIFALYYTVITMVSNIGAFCQYGTDMYQGTLLLGSLGIEAIPTATPLNTSIGAIDYISTTNTTTSDSTSLSSGLGRTIELPDMNITYDYVGARINSKDLYTAVLSGLADAAKAGMDTVCTELHAYSQAGNLVFWLDGDDQATQPLTYESVTTIFRSIVEDMTLRERRFAEINFIVLIEADGGASGFIAKLPLQGNGTAGVVAAK